jgi:hypothetical protein
MGSEFNFEKNHTESLIFWNKLGYWNDIILMNQPNILLVPSKALDTFANTTSLYDLHGKSNRAVDLKSCDIIPQILKYSSKDEYRLILLKLDCIKRSPENFVRNWDSYSGGTWEPDF